MPRKRGISNLFSGEVKVEGYGYDEKGTYVIKGKVHKDKIVMYRERFTPTVGMMVEYSYLESSKDKYYSAVVTESEQVIDGEEKGSFKLELSFPEDGTQESDIAFPWDGDEENKLRLVYNKNGGVKMAGEKETTVLGDYNILLGEQLIYKDSGGNEDTQVGESHSNAMSDDDDDDNGGDKNDDDDEDWGGSENEMKVNDR